MRRIQAASLIVALLAVPLALVARACVGAGEECTMACCRGHHAMKVNMCQHGQKGAASCTMGCSSQTAPDYGLASPLGPFQLAAVAQLDAPEVRRGVLAVTAAANITGYLLPPFQPPRV